ncbi:30S ribosomal protein S2 [Patescibacteria group bacterium]|nr:30S ribosomal protein S2 [Patescibacteria group bacterium]
MVEEINSPAGGEKIEEVKKPESKFGVSVSEMAEAGLHFGHRTSRIHPKMKQYISGVKSTVHVIDLEQTAQKLEKALEYIKKLTLEGKSIVFVGTKVQVKGLLKSAAEECGVPYINERWLGGTFTNFKIIKKRIDYFKDLEQKKATGELEKYTKKERLKMDKELSDMERKFGGLKNLTGLPDAVFVLDMRKDSLVVKEAIMKNIPIIAIADTNVNPDLATYVIPANDDAVSSVEYILNKVKEVILNNKSKE